MPELFRSVLAPEKAVASASAAGQASVSAVIERTRSAWRAGASRVLGAVAPEVAGRALQDVSNWWGRERIDKAAETCLPNRYLDALAVDGTLLAFELCGMVD